VAHIGQELAPALILRTAAASQPVVPANMANFHEKERVVDMWTRNYCEPDWLDQPSRRLTRFGLDGYRAMTEASATRTRVAIGGLVGSNENCRRYGVHDSVTSGYGRPDVRRLLNIRLHRHPTCIILCHIIILKHMAAQLFAPPPYPLRSSLTL